jgi:predicted short-subunit dehydrogenase-like oxidoreductase (DUF2520 family)
MTNASIDALRLGIVGAGRLGTALAWSFARRGCRVVATASGTRASAEKLAAPIAGCRPVDAVQDVVDASDLVLIAAPDGAITQVVEHARWRAGMAVVHCSGVSEVALLAKAADDGAMIGGFHPMQTFGDPEAAVQSLPGCTVTIEANEPLDAWLVALAQRLECRVNRLPPGARALYHAAGGYASQFINVLLRESSKVWQSWGATEEDAVRALLPLVRGTIASIERAGLAHGMPGPVSRGDVGSVAKHVAALQRLDPEILALYRELCGRTVPLAIERNGIDAQVAERIRQALAGRS